MTQSGKKIAVMMAIGVPVGLGRRWGMSAERRPLLLLLKYSIPLTHRMLMLQLERYTEQILHDVFCMRHAQLSLASQPVTAIGMLTKGYYQC